MGVHDGHRKRMTDRFHAEGLDHFSSHNVLELLLFFTIPRQDTNELAHRLLDAFGSLAGVFDAPMTELVQVPGIGERSATLIKMVPDLARVYLSDKNTDVVINSSEKAGKYLVPRFVGRSEETVFMVCLDGKSKVISTNLLHEGSVNSAEVNLRKIVSTALKYNAVGVIIAHNHPGGVALPSPEDLATTHRIRGILEPVHVALLDHLIVADNDYVSLADSGALGGKRY